jgi:hypothetical protein
MYHISAQNMTGGLLAILFSAVLISSPPRLAAGDGPSPAPTTRPRHPVDPLLIPHTETIVIFRHGEKPANGLGQLTPQGLNRALALCEVLPRKFGKPQYLFAPDPAEKVKDKGGPFNYVRPLATIEPLAISLGMPVQTPCGFLEIGQLEEALNRTDYENATIFVSWEHIYAYKLASDLLNSFHADMSSFPKKWESPDYDSLYVIRIRRRLGHAPEAKFTLDHEDLNGQSTTMPAAAPVGK